MRAYRAASEAAIGSLLESLERMLPNFDDQLLLTTLMGMSRSLTPDGAEDRLSNDAIRFLIEFSTASAKRREWPNRHIGPNLLSMIAIARGIIALQHTTELCRQKLATAVLELDGNVITVSSGTIAEFDIVAYQAAMRRVAPDHLLLDPYISHSSHRPPAFDSVEAALASSGFGGLTTFLRVAYALLEFALGLSNRWLSSSPRPRAAAGPWRWPVVEGFVLDRLPPEESSSALRWLDVLTLRPAEGLDWIDVLLCWSERANRKYSSGARFQPILAYDNQRVMLQGSTLLPALLDWLELLINGQWPFRDCPPSYRSAGIEIAQRRQTRSHRDDLWDALGFPDTDSFPGPTQVPATDLVVVASVDMKVGQDFGIELSSADDRGVAPGEIDLLVVDHLRRVIWVGEVKDPDRVFSPYDMFSDLKTYEFTKEAKAYSSKLAAKVAAVEQAGTARLAAHLMRTAGTDVGCREEFEVRGLFISRDITVFAFHERSSWFHAALLSLRHLLVNCPSLDARPWRQPGWWFEDLNRIASFPPEAQLSALARAFEGLPPHSG